LAEPRAPRAEARARRARILAAARARFLENGLAGTSTREIADAAAVPESSMFRHFATKDELFEEAIGGRLEELLHEARAYDVSALATAATPAARLVELRRMHRHYLEVMEETTPLLGTVVFAEREAGRRVYRARLQPLLDGMAEMSPAAMRGWAAADADPAVMIQLAFGGYLVFAADAYFRGVPLDHERVAARIAWLIQYGVAGRTSGVEPPPRADAPDLTGLPALDVVTAPEPDPGPGPGRQRRLRSDAIANRARLADAARAEFFARGLGGATTREIAEAAGTTESALYRHFGSKEQLFAHAVADRLRDIAAEGLAAARTGFAELTDDGRLALLEQQHLYYLRVIEETAPLLGAALFSERAVGQRCWAEIVRPFLVRMGAATHAALPPWANAGADGQTVIQVAFGGYVLLALDGYLGGRPLRHEELAAKITRVLYRGMAG
jgi:AcrR family transcriptional regulator